MSAPSNFNVVAIVNLAYQTHARLLDGVLAYVKTHSPWTLNLIVGRRDEQKRFDPAALDGLILYNASHLGAVFRRRCGAPPSSFR